MSRSEEDRLRLERAAAAIARLQKRVAELEGAARDPVAVIGIGCRFPGGVHGADDLWRLLLDGRDAIRPVPPERWDNDALYDSDPAATGRLYTREGGFLDDDIRCFDAAFFSISPREAASVDPQQRLLLEVAWEALEHAGIPPAGLTGSKTAVYLGFFSFDYYNLHVQAGDDRIDAYTGTGNTASVAAGRISYTLGLEGPSVALDTACSSSLVAVHLATRSLRQRECDLALAGGVNLMLTPDRTIYFCRLGALAPDGRCKAFDARADGYARGEGVGMVVLRRLADAARDGDRVLAIVRGSASNQDGRSNGLTAPNRLAQMRAIEAALVDAGAAATDVGYVEAHGSGTPLGDPIELGALSAALGVHHPADRPLLVGAIKSNFGHTEAAAGIAGFIKATLIAHHGVVPPHLHFDTPSPLVDWSAPVRVPTRPTPLQGSLIGVNSFGFSGTNAHVVLQRPDHLPTPERRVGPKLIAVSARSAPSLDLALERVAGVAEHVEPADLAYTLGARRSHHPLRVAVVGDEPAELAAGLRSAGRAARGGPVAFLFPGQGSQWAGMGAALYDEEPAFRETIDAADRAIAAFAPYSVAEVVRGVAAVPLDRLDVVQPALFAMSIAIAALLRSWGVVPAVVLGQSMGEVAAACVAGALTLEDAARVICRRSALALEVTGRGGMALVELGLEAARELVAGDAEVNVAVALSPRQTVLSGTHAALGRVRGSLEATGTFFRAIQVDFASHGPAVDPLLGALRRELAPVRPTDGTIAMRSTVTGGLVAGRALDGAYWVRNLRDPVLLWPVVRELGAEGFTIVEVSPHPVAAPGLDPGLASIGAAATVTTLRRGEGRAALLRAAAALYERGADLDFAAVNPGPARLVDLPPYPWDGQVFWREGLGRRVDDAPTSDLPGAPVANPLADRSLVARVGSQRYVREHVVGGRALVPAAAWVYAALGAAASSVLEDGVLTAGLWCDEGSPDIAVHTTVRDGRAIAVHSRSTNGGFTLHLSARAGGTPGEAFAADVDAVDAEPADAHYAAMDRRGYTFGPLYRSLTTIRRGHGQVRADVAPRPAGVAGDVATLDLLFQAAAAALPPDADVPLRVPASFRLLWATDLDAVRSIEARVDDADVDGSVRMDVLLSDAHGRAVAGIVDLVARPLRTLPPAFRTAWAPAPPVMPTEPGSWWVQAPEGPAARWIGSLAGRVAPLPADLADPEPDRILFEPAATDARGAALEALALAQRVLATGRRGLRITLAAPGVDRDPRLSAARAVLLSASLERPELQVDVADLDPDADLLDPDEVLDASRALGEVRVRGGVVLRPDLIAAGDLGAPEPIDPDGTYLITGGFGAIGLELGRALVRGGARHVVLAGRHAPDTSPFPEAELATVDVTDADAVRALVGRLGRLRGVIHAAAVLDDALLPDLDPERFATAWRAKADGAWNLHEALGARPLQFFVLMGSTAGLLGAPGQASYAAANGALAALTELRGAAGLAATCIDWPPWSEIGLAAAAKQRGARLEGLGIRGISTSAGIASFEALRAAGGRVAILDLDVARWQQALPHAVPAVLASRLRAPSSDVPPWRALLAAEPSPAARRRALVHLLVERLAGSLRLPPGAIDPAQTLGTFGLDSLMALEVRNGLERAIGIELPATLLWSYPSADSVADHLLDRLGLAERSDDALEELDDDEIARLLEAELADPG